MHVPDLLERREILHIRPVALRTTEHPSVKRLLRSHVVRPINETGSDPTCGPRHATITPVTQPWDSRGTAPGQPWDILGHVFKKDRALPKGSVASGGAAPLPLPSGAAPMCPRDEHASPVAYSFIISGGPASASATASYFDERQRSAVVLLRLGEVSSSNVLCPCSLNTPSAKCMHGASTHRFITRRPSQSARRRLDSRTALRVCCLARLDCR